MKFIPTKFPCLTIVLLSLFVLSSCSKDSDLFTDLVVNDSKKPVGQNPGGQDDPSEGELVAKTFAFSPTDDAYIQDIQGYDQSVMKLEENNRMSYIMFDLTPLKGNITDVSLEFTVEGDAGNGTIDVYKGLETTWTEENLTQSNAPNIDILVGSVNKSYTVGSTENIDLQASEFLAQKTTLILLHSKGNDLSLASKEHASRKGPKLKVTYMAPKDSDDLEEPTAEEPVAENPGPPPSYSPDCDYGGDCMTPDYSCIDPQYPVIEEWVKAGVEGGIPSGLAVVRTIGPSDNIQSAINDVASSGGGVILLRSGTYPLSSTVNMKSNVVLRGEDKESVILESTIRNTSNFNNGSIFFDNGVSRAGLENLTYFYRVDGCEPIDDISGAPEDFYVVHANDPCGRSDLRTAGVVMYKEAHNNWIDNCNILESGSHPVRIWGNHNTVRKTYVNRTYNKGGGGVGYFYISGDYNLIVNNDINRLRHVGIDGYGGVMAPKYNVIFGNRMFRVDVNFHEYDGGYNLVEQNQIWPEDTHHLSGKPILTGHQPSGHGLPGPFNFIYNNDTSQAGEPINGEPGIIYTFEVGAYQSVINSGLSQPSCGTFYPMQGN